MSLPELRERALAQAIRWVGVRENGGPNRGPQIERWLALVGLPPGNAWCMAFVYACFNEAALGLGVPNPLPRTGGVSKMWERSPLRWRSSKSSRGAIFIHRKDPTNPYSLGHCGLVEGVDGDELLTVEGNTDPGGSREGDGVYRRRRPAHGYVLGYLDPAREGPDEEPRLG